MVSLRCFTKSNTRCFTAKSRFSLAGVCVWHDSVIRATWLIRMCDMTHLYVWHDSLRCATKSNTLYVTVKSRFFLAVWRDSVICVSWLIGMCAVTQWYVCHDSFMCVAWLIDICDMTPIYVCRDSVICVTRPFNLCDMTHSCVWHDSFTPVGSTPSNAARLLWQEIHALCVCHFVSVNAAWLLWPPSVYIGCKWLLWPLNVYIGCTFTAYVYIHIAAFIAYLYIHIV